MALEANSHHNARIAVIIPVYNVTDFLEEAIASAREQNYPQKEIIVVDDGSAPEHSAEISLICKKFTDVTLLQQPHSGAACARRTGVLHTSADFILFLDADDILLPDTLNYFANALHQSPDTIATYGRRRMIDKHGKIISEPKPPIHCMVSGSKVLPMQLSGRFLLSNGTVCIRRQALEKLSPGNYTLKQGEDWVLWCHLALSGDIIPAGDRIVLHYRRHEQNTSSNYIKDPSLLYTALDIVFTDQKFIDAIGEKQLHDLHEMYLCRIHAQLASGYAAQSQRQKAVDHLTKGAMYIKTLSDSRKDNP